MGIQDRDYYRDDTSGYREVWGRQGVAVWIIAITCGVFFGQCITGDPAKSPLVTVGALKPDLVLQGEVWRLFTPLFLHSGLFHLFCNMLVLYWAGSRMEERYGSREFLAFYVLAGLFSSIVYVVAAVSGLSDNVGAVGASGAITAVFVLFACHHPRQQVWLYFIVPMPIWVLVLIFVGLDMLGAAQVAAGVPAAPIGYFAHLGGALFGGLYYLTSMRITELFRRAPRAARARPKLRVLPTEPEDDTPTPVGAAVENQPRPKETQEPVDEQLEARLDQVLEKVSKYGQESLTPEEREILFRASEVYKKRRK
jgi:membrane associated rhomboid family serine protease